jgi:hypothetical protein
MKLLLSLLLVASLVRAEDESAGAEPKKVGPGDIKIEEPGAPIDDKNVAKDYATRFKEKMKAAEAPEEKAKLLTKLGEYDHPEIYRAASRYARNKSEAVAIAAIVTCARQSKAKAKAGGFLFKAVGNEKRPAVVCALLVGMGHLGYDKKNAYKLAEKIYRRDTTETHKAAARYFGYVKAKAAFRMLAEKLDEPKNTAPPQSRKKTPILSEEERKKLWYEWKSAVPYVRWALSEIVPGETFETTLEAKMFVADNAAKKKYRIGW